jgi:hypothetical protein
MATPTELSGILNFDLVAYLRYPIDSAQRLLEHLLLEKRIDFAAQDNFALGVFQEDMTANAVRVFANYRIDPMQE